MNRERMSQIFPWPEDKSRVQWVAIQVNGLTEEYLATKGNSTTYRDNVGRKQGSSTKK